MRGEAWRERYGVPLGAVLGLAVGLVAVLISGDVLAWSAISVALGGLAGAYYATRRDDEARLFPIVVPPMSVATIWALAVSRATHDVWWQSVLIGLAGVAVGVLVTVFYVEKLLRDAEQRRREPKRVFAQFRLKRDAWLLVEMIGIVFGHRVDRRAMMASASGGAVVLTPKGEAFVMMLERDVADGLRRVPDDHWEGFVSVLDDRVKNFSDLALLCGDVLEPEEARDVLEVQLFTETVANSAGFPAEAFDEHLSAIVERCHRLLRL